MSTDSIENNILIAEFMGAFKEKEYIDQYTFPFFLPMDISKCYAKGQTITNNAMVCLPQNMSFHSSWDWLIPVIDKIYSSNEYQKYKETGSQFGKEVFINTKFINITYESVVEFIKWYNQRKDK